MTGIWHWFWRLIPGNPQLVRIVQGGSRRRSHQVFRATYLGVLMLMVLFAVLAAGGTQVLSLNELAQGGAQVFRVIAYGQVVLVCLLAPLLMASALGSEQQGETYEILLTTPLSSAQIVLGSLLGRLFFIVAILLSGLPFFSVVLLFGGVPVASVFQSFAVACLTALFVGVIAVTISVFRLGGRRTVFAFVIAVAGYLVGAYLLDFLILRRLNATVGGPSLTTFLTPLHPILVLDAIVNSANYASPSSAQLADVPNWWRYVRLNPLAIFAWLTLGSSLVMMLVSALALRPISQGDWLLLRWVKHLFGHGQARPGRTVGKHAIAWRESHTRGRGWVGWLGKSAYVVICLLAAGGLLIAHHQGSLPQLPGGAGGMMLSHEVLLGGLTVLLILQVAVLALVAVYVSASSVSKEREDGTLDLILTTPVTPKQYIWGKLRGLVRSLAVLVAAPVLTMTTVAIYANWGMSQGVATASYSVSGAQVGQTLNVPVLLWETPLLALLMLAPFIAACVAFGMSRSLVSKTVLGAVGKSVALVGLLSVVFGFCGYSAAATIPFVGGVLNAMSPATGLLMLVNPWDRLAGFRDFTQGARIGLFLGVLIAAGLYSIVVYSLVVGMVRGFDQNLRKLTGV